MTDFTIKITDASELAGLSAARAAYNVENGTKLSDAAYFAHVAGSWFKSYAAQASDPIIARDRELAAKSAEIEALKSAKADATEKSK